MGPLSGGMRPMAQPDGHDPPGLIGEPIMPSVYCDCADIQKTADPVEREFGRVSFWPCFLIRPYFTGVRRQRIAMLRSVSRRDQPASSGAKSGTSAGAARWNN